MISDSLGREICLDELWSGRARSAELGVPADAGMDQLWTPADTGQVLDDWLGHTGGAMGWTLAVSGVTLTAPAWAYVDHLGTRGGLLTALGSGGGVLTVTSGTVDTLAATTAGLRALGGAEGGHEDTLRLVHHHLIYVAKLLRQARFTSFPRSREPGRAHIRESGSLQASRTQQRSLAPSEQQHDVDPGLYIDLENTARRGHPG